MHVRSHRLGMRPRHACCKIPMSKIIFQHFNERLDQNGLCYGRCCYGTLCDWQKRQLQSGCNRCARNLWASSLSKKCMPRNARIYARAQECIQVQRSGDVHKTIKSEVTVFRIVGLRPDLSRNGKPCPNANVLEATCCKTLRGSACLCKIEEIRAPG